VRNCFETVDHSGPGHARQRRGGPSADPSETQRRPSQLDRARDEGGRLSIRDEHAGFPVRHVHARRGVIVGNEGEAARDRFQDTFPNVLGLAREEKDVGRGILRGELLANDRSAEDEVGVAFLQRGPLGPSPTRTNRRAPPTRCIARYASTASPVLLRCDSPDIERDDVVVRRGPMLLVMPHTGAPA